MITVDSEIWEKMQIALLKELRQNEKTYKNITDQNN